MDDPSSFTTSGGMYTIESLHDNLNLDALMFSNSYPSAPLLEVPVVHCAAQTAARGAFKTPHPVPQGLLLLSHSFGQILGPFPCCKPRALPIDTGLSIRDWLSIPDNRITIFIPRPSPLFRMPIVVRGLSITASLLF